MNKNKILIVDDEKPILRVLSEIFEIEGFEVDIAENGLECLEKINKIEFNVVILDIKMPVLDGIETLKYIKKHHAHLPVIMCSGHANTQTASEAMKIGAYDFISKPPELNRVLNSISNACLSNPPQIEQHIIKSRTSVKVVFEEVLDLRKKVRFFESNLDVFALKYEFLLNKFNNLNTVRDEVLQLRNMITQKSDTKIDKNKLKSEISQGNTLEVIKILIEALTAKKSDLANDLIVIQAELVMLIKKMGMGLISSDEERLFLNRINNSILKIIDVV
jgi:CheY-like chemotaxis protein